LAERRVGADEDLIDGDPGGRERAGEAGVGGREGPQEVARGRARGHLEDDVITPEGAPEAGEDEDGEAHDLQQSSRLRDERGAASGRPSQMSEALANSCPIKPGGAALPMNFRARPVGSYPTCPRSSRLTWPRSPEIAE